MRTTTSPLVSLVSLNLCRVVSSKTCSNHCNSSNLPSELGGMSAPSTCSRAVARAIKMPCSITLCAPARTLKILFHEQASINDTFTKLIFDVLVSICGPYIFARCYATPHVILLRPSNSSMFYLVLNVIKNKKQKQEHCSDVCSQ